MLQIVYLQIDFMNMHTTINIYLGYHYKLYQVVREDFPNVWVVLEYQNNLL